MNQPATVAKWKRDARRIKDLLETADCLTGYNKLTDAIDCLQKVRTMLETWQNNTIAQLADINYKADEQRRTTTRKETH